MGCFINYIVRLGFHLSIGQGFGRVLDQGLKLGCECAQIFSRNPRSWTAKPIVESEAEAFQKARQKAGLTPLAIHLPYLVNLSAEDDDLWTKSVAGMTEELVRGKILGAEYLVVHPGRVGGQSREQALIRAARGLARAFTGESEPSPLVLLETTAGQKGELGDSFEDLAEIRRELSADGLDRRIGFCVDTAHIWAAGYDLSSQGGLETTLFRFEQTLGLSELKLIHLNDSVSGLGSRVDRHAPAGQGQIGPEGLAAVVGHPELKHLAGIMETPLQNETAAKAHLDLVKSWRRTGGINGERV